MKIISEHTTSIFNILVYTYVVFIKGPGLPLALSSAQFIP
jgi:hypothetical protein